MYILGLVTTGPLVSELSHACHLHYDLFFQGDLPTLFRACSCGDTISKTTQSSLQKVCLEKGNMLDFCGDGNIEHFDCVYVNILVVILYHNLL